MSKKMAISTYRPIVRKIKSCADLRCRTRRIESNKVDVYITIESHLRGIPIIVVTTAAIKEYSYNELDAALLHEIGHYRYKHSIKNLFRALTLRKADIIAQEIEADAFVAKSAPWLAKHMISLLSRNKDKNYLRITAIRKLIKNHNYKLSNQNEDRH